MLPDGGRVFDTIDGAPAQPTVLAAAPPTSESTSPPLEEARLPKKSVGAAQLAALHRWVLLYLPWTVERGTDAAIALSERGEIVCLYSLLSVISHHHLTNGQFVAFASLLEDAFSFTDCFVGSSTPYAHHRGGFLAVQRFCHGLIRQPRLRSKHACCNLSLRPGDLRSLVSLLF